MAYPRTLTDEQLYAARWEWEHTPATKVQIAAKWGMTPAAVHKWVMKQGWAKASELKTYDGPNGEAEFQQDLAAAVRAAFDREIIQGLIETLAKGVTSDRSQKVKSVVAAAKAGKPKAKAATPAPPPPPDRPAPPPASPPSTPGAGPIAGKRGRGRPRKHPAPTDTPGQVIAFPRNFQPPPKGSPQPLPPPPTRAEQLAIRTHLSKLRGELTVQQLEAIDRHDQMLDEYQHLISVFLNPSRYVDTAGLSEEEAIERLRQVTTAAARAILPSERDTLANAITALSRARLQSILTKRQVAGLVARKLNGTAPDPDDGEGDGGKAGAEVARMDVQSLRKVREAMEMLTKHTQRREPPRPPPPDPLDDLLPASPPEPPPDQA